jgi:tetratricopeptide (TPR) repeat protein
MYVAYNPFYVPALAHVEKRNASPDRSHNETWDALVITGVLGILIYLFLFSLVFYYGLKWLGLIVDRRQRNLFLLLILGFGLIGAVGLSLWRSVEYFGVGLPFGMLIGLLLYITLVAIFSSYRSPSTPGEELRSLTLIVLIAAIVSHFVEINFGIAIAVTRTYFWTYAALLVAVGYILPIYNEYDLSGVENQKIGNKSLKQPGKKSSRRKKRSTDSGTFSSLYPHLLDKNVLVAAIVITIIIVTLGFDFFSNPRGLASAREIIWASITRLPNQNFAVSYGVFTLILTSGLAMGIVWASENVSDRAGGSWWKNFGSILAISFLLTLIYWLWHAGSLATIARNTANDMAAVMEQVGRYESLLTNYYLYIFFLLILMAAFLPIGVSRRVPNFTVLGAIGAAIALIVVAGLVAYSNLRVIQADIAFKLADPFTRSGQWPVAISIYDRANELAPNEDYYYLFLGRAYLEHAKTLDDVEERNRFIIQADEDLKKAQKINPLNTDHTANLARLYSLWSSYGGEEDEHEELALVSADYFSSAVTLSPKNARIWNEWALLYMNNLNQAQEAFVRLNHALGIDPEYHWTYALLGEYYLRQAVELTDDSEKTEVLEIAADNYSKAIALTGRRALSEKHNYGLALGGVYIQLGRFDEAIAVYKQAVEDAPTGAALWRVEEAIASLYAQQGDSKNALLHVMNALKSAPEDQRDRLQNIIRQLNTSQP